MSKLSIFLAVARAGSYWRQLFATPTQNILLQEKLFQYGVTSLADYELLDLLLNEPRLPKKTTSDIQSLLHKFDRLRGLFNAHTDQLHTHPKLNNQDIARIKVVPELIRRQLLEDIKRGPSLSTSSAVRRYVRQCMRDYDREVFMCIFLNARHQVIRVEELFVGSISGAHVYPREVARKCIQHNAVSVILVHNHPSGKPEPSASDERVTRRLSSVLTMLDINVVDHLVVGENEVVSFNQRGLI